MNHTHFPRPLIILLFILVGVIFSAGTLRSFTPAHAVANATATPVTPAVLNMPSKTPLGPSSETPLSASTATLTVQADRTESFTPTPTLTPGSTSADTTGIIALAILMVIVMLAGIAWGARSQRKQIEPQK